MLFLFAEGEPLAECAQIAGRNVEERGDVLQREHLHHLRTAVDEPTVAAAGGVAVVVEVEKQAASRTLSQATAADLGKIAGADGNIYDSKDAASTAGTTATGRLRRSMKASPVACPSSAVPNGTTAALLFSRPWAKMPSHAALPHAFRHF